MKESKFTHANHIANKWFRKQKPYALNTDELGYQEQVTDKKRKWRNENLSKKKEVDILIPSFSMWQMVDPKQFKGELILSWSCRKYSPLGEEGNGGEQGDRKSVSNDHLTSAVKESR